MTAIKRRAAMIALAAAPALAWAVPARAGTLDATKKRGTLRIGVTQAPPWFTKNPANGEWSSGLGISMGKAMAEKLGVKMETVEVSWGTAIAALQADKIDLMFMLDATEERQKAVDFPTSPLLFYSLAVLAKDDLAVKAWADLDKPAVKIAVPQASSMDKFLSENTKTADIQRFPDNAAAIAAFQSGRVDAVCLFHPPLLAARQRLGRGKIVVPTPVRSQASSVAMRKGDTEFVAWVDKFIDESYRSGQTQKHYETALREFGLDPSMAPPVMKERLG